MTRRGGSYRKKARSRQSRTRRSRAQLKAQRQRRAQAALSGLEELFDELVLPTGLEQSLRRKLGGLSRLLAQLFAMMLPSAFGAGSYNALAERFGWSRNRAGQLLNALPTTGWQRKLRRVGRSVVKAVQERVQNASAATSSRWRMVLAIDSSVIRKFGEFLGLAAPAYSGQYGTTVNGLDVLLLVAVFGDGRLVVPLDVQIHRPQHDGPGRPSDDKLTWTDKMLERTLTPLSLSKGPILLADSWFGSSKLFAALAEDWHGGLIIQGKGTWVMYLQNAIKAKGSQLFNVAGLKWRLHPDLAGWSYARLQANSPTFGQVLLTLVRPPKDKPYYLMCPVTLLPSTCLIQLYRRRSSVEWCFRTLKHLLEVGLCQVRTEQACYGHLVLRLMGLTLLAHARLRRLADGATIEQMLSLIKEHYQTLDSKILHFA